jgi:hypothetical protein
MIEDILRDLHPKFDGSFIEGIREGKNSEGKDDPVIREMILWEYGLEPLLPYAIDLKKVSEGMRDFAHYHGTLFSIRMALGWVGFPSAKLTRLSRTDYEIDPGRVPTEREVEAIRAACEVSVQARGILKRIFNGNFEVKL